MTSSRANTRTIRLLVVAGARPNFMKVAPLLRAMRCHPRIESFLVHTGQHYDASMSDAFFRDLEISKPDANLGAGSGSHAVQTADVLRGIEPILIDWEPDAVVVVGDVNSTLAATLAAVKLGIPVAHVEAGLRSFDRRMPEEINRIVTDSISEWLFTSEPSGGENLRREGICAARIHFVGNVMIDSLLAHIDRARAENRSDRLGLEPNGYAVLTLHRPSNVDDANRLRDLFAALERIHREIPVVFPVHPRTQASIASLLNGHDPVLRTTEPLGYVAFLGLMAGARLVVTDSGGIQEETTALGIPCLTLRDSTERPVTVSEGTNLLIGSDPGNLQREVGRILAGDVKEGRVPELWDGQAAQRIISILEADLSSRSN